ncbi:MAG: hypothetical protein AVDCRST_MAG02-1010 [uncultured Rubrobacteraceae bacterium]|uniref:Sulfotransferase n=1 Tax=uncultured Rubrobacteraceae bacterium TaxID=349277 RepID=A0A6J4QRH1_9ACTN|nr:MAG: hypothetical protein AVDCRST_MAG02-1010 [uncultured Rubrobacteraceae bacterium]
MAPGPRFADARGRNRRAGTPAAEEGRTVFFIVGHGKSGTTWLARLLGSHPEILCLWEGRFFGKKWYREDLRAGGRRCRPERSPAPSSTPGTSSCG